MVANKGRLINFINGITGIVPGGQGVVNMPVNQRNHRLAFQCTAVNYTAPVVTFATPPGGTPATFTATVVNGAITAIVIATAGSGQTPGTYNLTITDPTGTGATATAVVAAGGTVTATPTVTSAGTPSAINPGSIINNFKLLVNGVNMRDIDVANYLKIQQANGYYARLGELLVPFTEPWTNVSNQSDVTSWDLFGQSTFQIQIGITPNVVTPGVVGTMEFDYFRNEMLNGGTMQPFLQPVAYHQFSWPIVSGRNDINTLPFNFPIRRMWLQGSTAGNISQVELFQDGNKPLETTLAQNLQNYEEYGFNFGKGNFLNSGYAASNALKGQYNAPSYFDAAYIADPDQRFWKALNVEKAMILRVYSSIAQTLTIVMETLPGSFAS